MIPAIERYVQEHAVHFFGAETERVSSLMLSFSRHKRPAAGRVLQLIFAEGSAAPALVACFPRDRGAAGGLARENAILERLSPAGLAPASLGLARVSGRPVLFEAALAGVPAEVALASAWHVSPREPGAVRSLVERLVEGAAAFITSLQALPAAEAPPSPFAAIDDSADAFALEFGLDDWEAVLLRARLDAYAHALAEQPPVWTHGDLSFGNLMLSESGALTAFDWEFAGAHADPARDAMHLAYYAFVQLFQLGLFGETGFQGAFLSVFHSRGHWLAGLFDRLTPGHTEGARRDALLAFLVQDALLQASVSLRFGPENRAFHRQLVAQLLDPPLIVQELLTTRQALERSNAAIGEARDEAVALAAARDRLETELHGARAEAADAVNALNLLEGRFTEQQEHLARLEAQNAELGLHLHRINARWPVRAYRALRARFAR